MQRVPPGFLLRRVEDPFRGIVAGGTRQETGIRLFRAAGRFRSAHSARDLLRARLRWVVVKAQGDISFEEKAGRVQDGPGVRRLRGFFNFEEREAGPVRLETFDSESREAREEDARTVGETGAQARGQRGLPVAVRGGTGEEESYEGLRDLQAVVRQGALPGIVCGQLRPHSVPQSGNEQLLARPVPGQPEEVQKPRSAGCGGPRALEHPLAEPGFKSHGVLLQVLFLVVFNFLRALRRRLHGVRHAIAKTAHGEIVICGDLRGDRATQNPEDIRG